MTLDPTNTIAPEAKQNDKEYNFRQLEAKYERQIAQERAEREKISRELDEIRQNSVRNQPEDDDSEPYVDHKKLEKKFSSFEKRLEEKIDQRADQRARQLLDNEKKQSWMQTNSDFYDVMQHAEKLAQTNPDLADTILRMPDSFERQKLVYSNIKALGLHKPESKQPSIQEKIDANKRSPYYQPSGVAPAPYAQAGDFSPVGQKNAYDQMKALQNKMRLG
jgi:hypothetical protein